MKKAKWDLESPFTGFLGGDRFVAVWGGTSSRATAKARALGYITAGDALISDSKWAYGAVDPAASEAAVQKTLDSIGEPIELGQVRAEDVRACLGAAAASVINGGYRHEVPEGLIELPPFSE